MFVPAFVSFLFGSSKTGFHLTVFFNYRRCPESLNVSSLTLTKILSKQCKHKNRADYRQLSKIAIIH